MQLLQLRLIDFRNLPEAELLLGPGRHFLVGENGQGKTNLLEAAAYITALRSFRGAESRALIRIGQPCASLAWTVAHERLGETCLTARLAPGSKEVTLDGQPVDRLADILGRFPTVTFSSQDLALLRGAPSARRRFFDFLLSSTDPAYFEALQRYHRGLLGRNRLLREGAGEAAVAAFEPGMAEEAVVLAEKRRRACAELGGLLREAYGRFGAEGETPALTCPSVEEQPSADGWRALWEKERARDSLHQTTRHGPHRADWPLLLNGRHACDYASEGQQRSLILALKLAQFSFARQRTGLLPVLLADDVLGELDPGRRQRFWSALPEDTQVLATGTALPEDDPARWSVRRVRGGAVSAG